jgi:hypothetical protein
MVAAARNSMRDELWDSSEISKRVQIYATRWSTWSVGETLFPISGLPHAEHSRTRRIGDVSKPITNTTLALMLPRMLLSRAGAALRAPGVGRARQKMLTS